MISALTRPYFPYDVRVLRLASGFLVGEPFFFFHPQFPLYRRAGVNFKCELQPSGRLHVGNSRPATEASLPLIIGEAPRMRGRMGAWERGGTEFCASVEPANRLPSLRCDCPAAALISDIELAIRREVRP